MKELIERVINLIKRGWTQEAAARDKDGKEVVFSGHDATCFCLVGAINKITLLQPDQRWLLNEAIANQIKKIWKKNSQHDLNIITRWNDMHGRTKEQVIELLESML